MTERELRGAIEILPNRLYYVALSAQPSKAAAGKNDERHFFSIDQEFIYWNFFLDFGPLNLGHVYRFCLLLNKKLTDPRLKDKIIYYYSGTHGHRRANACHLICSWQLIALGKTPEDAFKPFRGVTPFPPWHDATPTACSFNLTIMDTLRGLKKAMDCKFFDLSTFDVDEYEHYEQVENGDLNWLVDGKFVAFAGPHSAMHANEYHNLPPEAYVPYFKRKNVTLVVRLNKKYYDSASFTRQGIDHMDLYFLDGSNPPDHILTRFIQKAEDTPGAVAVHCKAGLGRTGCCIGAFVMKHYKFTAEEFIGWARIARPGTIIGPQQHWMKEIQGRMWREGEIHRSRLQSMPPSKSSRDDDLDGKMEGLSVSRSRDSKESKKSKEEQAEIQREMEREANGGITQGDRLRAARVGAQAQAHAPSRADGRGGNSLSRFLGIGRK
jgi:cell division cycle 14